MKIFRISNLLLLSVAAGLGTVLFWTSQSVQQAESRLAALTHDADSERETIRVLNAEWDYLNRPQRLEKLARQFLGVAPPESENFVASAEQIPERPLVGIVPPVKPAVFKKPAPIEEEEGGFIPVAVSAEKPASPVPAQRVHAEPAYAKAEAEPAPLPRSEKEEFEGLLQQLENER